MLKDLVGNIVSVGTIVAFATPGDTARELRWGKVEKIGSQYITITSEGYGYTKDPITNKKKWGKCFGKKILKIRDDRFLVIPISDMTTEMKTLYFGK